MEIPCSQSLRRTLQFFSTLKMAPYILVIINFLIISGCNAKHPQYECSSLHPCSSGPELDYPFFWQLTNESGSCGYTGFGYNCTRDGKTVLTISNNKHYVVAYNDFSITVVDINTEASECPRPATSFTVGSASFRLTTNAQINIFYNCSPYPPDLPHVTCLEYNTTKRSYAFYVDSHNFVPNNYGWYQSCEGNVVLPVLQKLLFGKGHNVLTDSNYTTTLKSGLQLAWYRPRSCRDCEVSDGICWVNERKRGVGCLCGDKLSLSNSSGGLYANCNEDRGLSQGLKITIGATAGIGALILILLLIFRKSLPLLYNRWIKIENPTNVDLFLDGYGNLALQRYTYSDVKKMTNHFKDTLGQGGYGSVFKGKLVDGRLVAVKILKEDKCNGEEFINEVATIGSTNHINVVRLLGFSSDKSKRALIYEYMSNGSLERFIYNKKKSSTASLPLGSDKLYQIALGIAKGLEYLHTGCNNRILHFDIKPHNILLNEDFSPKISDFGLAKLCPTRDSVVSMPGARGTIGYIAPEVIFRNYGGVSYKSDVYSYGMMVLEMIGGRKNVDIVQNTSEIYFPQWIYAHIAKDGDLEESDMNFLDETTKKMVIVGLWCIQLHPTKRPSMSKIVEMLEGSPNGMDMPPDPFTDFSSTPTDLQMFSVSTS